MRLVSCPALVQVGCDLAGGAASSAGNGLADALVGIVIRGVGSAAAWVVGHIISLVDSTTSVDLTAPWFAHRERAMISLMGLVIVPLLAAGTIGAIIRQDLRRLVRTWAVALPVAVIVTVAAINLTQLALGAADAMTEVVSHDADLGVYRSFAGLVVGGGSGLPSGVAVLVAVLVMLGAASIWLELVVRSAAVYVAVFFLPLALAGLVWPATASMAKRLIEGLVALILSKFVIVATLTLGAGALTSIRGVDQAAAGTAILLLAAFAPFVLFRMVPVVEAAAVAHLEGLSRRPARSATRAATMATPAGAALSAVRGVGAAGGGLVTAKVAAESVPRAEGSYNPRTGTAPTQRSGAAGRQERK